MAKKSKIAKNKQREAVVERYRVKRRELKEVIADPDSSSEEIAKARRTLQGLPRDASTTRLRHRDAIDGRPRGNLRKFGISRMRFRQMAHDGQLPGVTKSSW